MRVPAALAALALTGLPGQAMVPLPPCDPNIEAGMATYNVGPFGTGEVPTGATIEGYGNAQALDGAVYIDRPGPTAALNHFHGVRITFCATGEFVAIRNQGVDDVNSSLSATEFLRADLKAGRAIKFAQVKRAAKAVYGPVIVMRETEQTCGCAAIFPALKPAGMTRFEDRTDLK